MLYRKPKDLKYTDMAIYIDANISKIAEVGENPEIEATIFKYLYLICYALACKKNFFYKFEDYDHYALYAAGQTYLLLRNQYNKSKTSKDGTIPIKSSLNYIKRVLYPFKVNYQKEYFQEIIQPESSKNIDMEAIATKIRDGVQADYNYELQEAIIDTFNYLPQIIKQVVNETPYVKNKLMLKNIYISCLLSFINSITLPNKKLKTKTAKNKELRLISNQTNKEQYIILWGLKPEMEDYIQLLINKIKKVFTQEFEATKNSFTLDDSTIDDIMASAYSDYDTNNNRFNLGEE